MRKRLYLVWLFRCLLLLSLMVCLSLLGALLIRCTSIKEVELQQPIENQNGEVIHLPQIVNEIKFNGKTYIHLSVYAADNNIPVLYYKNITNKISASGNDSIRKNLDVYKIDSIDTNIAIAIKMRDNPEVFERYINKDYLWTYQCPTIAILSLFSLIFFCMIILSSRCADFIRPYITTNKFKEC